MRLAIEVEVTHADLGDIMVTAIEGGINYWCDRYEKEGDPACPEWIAQGDEVFTHMWWIQAGGTMTFKVPDHQDGTLNLAKLEKGVAAVGAGQWPDTLG